MNVLAVDRSGLPLLGFTLLALLLVAAPRPASSQVRIFLEMQVLMDTDVERLIARETPRAAVRWNAVTPHPSLSYDQTRIVLAALHYGRILSAHEETRTELFERVGRAANRLAAGASMFEVGIWQLHAGGLTFPLWPWQLAKPHELREPKTYTANLIGPPERPGILLNMAFGLERVLAPASTVAVLTALTQELDPAHRVGLGVVLRAMNDYYGSPDRAAEIGSEARAVQASLSVLRGIQ